MRLARKLNMLLILGIIMVMGGYAYVETRQEVVLSDADRQRTQQVALAFLGTLEAVWQQEGGRRAAELVGRANERASVATIRLVSVDPSTGYLPRPDLTPEQFATLAENRLVRFVRRDDEGEERQYFYKALLGDPPPLAALEFVEPIGAKQRFISMSHSAMLLATLAVIVTCAVIVTAVDFWFVGQPIELLRDKARRAGRGDFSGPLLLTQRDEIGDLARELNLMCAQLEEARQRLASETEARMAALEQLRHTDRLATVGYLAAGVAHELGTPLSVASARAQLLASTDLPRPQVVANAAIIVEQADRMTAIIQQLLGFTRRRSTFGTSDVRHITTRALDLLSSAAKKARVSVDYQPSVTPLLARVDANQVLQALANIVLNGIQAMREGGVLRVRAEPCHIHPPGKPDDAARDYLRVTVADTGSGIAADALPHLFEPFFTTKETGEGTGLGLPVAQGIVAEHGGWITVDSTVGQGACFAIYLPQAVVQPETVAA
jgi:two-component system NtrC family sensor kinase